MRIALGALALTFAATLHAATISNVAVASWDEAGRTLSRASNRIDLTLDPAAPSFTLTAFRFDTGPGAEQLAVPQAWCGTGSALTPMSLAVPQDDGAQHSEWVVRTESVRAGEDAVVVVDYAYGNVDPAKVDTMVVAVTAHSGDRERLTISETGPDTGRFVGYIRTAPEPPAYRANDCVLGVADGDRILVEGLPATGTTPVASAEIGVLVDPFGIVFDTDTGRPVSGATVSLVDADTGQPAQVLGDDGHSAYPAMMVTGHAVTDTGGTVYEYPEGDYRFPIVSAGRYRLIVNPPAPYAAPSTIPPDQLARFRRPNGKPYTLTPGSFGGLIVLTGPGAMRIDVPVDTPSAPLLITKTASTTTAMPGETVLYSVSLRNPDARHGSNDVTLRDVLPDQMRLRAGSVRINGAAAAAAAVTSSDGRAFAVALGNLAPGATRIVQYALEVRPDAKPGIALNRAQAADSHGTRTAIAEASVEITDDTLAGRMTIVGQLLDGGCGVDPRGARGIAGVRVMLEDGTYSVTDRDGRYHFEGVVPGLHVVQLDRSTLPADRAAVDCARETRSGGNPASRFVEGRGGMLKRVDFHGAATAPRTVHHAVMTSPPAAAGDAAAAGAERDWFAGQAPGIAWLFPEADHNPRARAVRVAIKHLPGQKVKLYAGGKPVEAIAFDGTRRSPDGQVAVSLWRGIPLGLRDTDLAADVVDADGKVVQHLTRTVHFAASPLRAELLRDKSTLVADGVTRPAIAVRFTDRDGRPVHQGLVGDYAVPAPYYPAVEADAQQARQLAGLERARPVWRVAGDDGIAYIELEPTTASGTVSITLPLRDGDVSREQRLEAWLDPGDRPWTVVGFAAGTLGYATLANGMEPDAGGKTMQADARLALYAKGRIKGKWLMTLSYDSKKKEDQTRFAGTIDPQAYYTIYADRSEQRYDAASVRKLYLRLERPQFYALFGDYETGITDPQLARYSRAMNGVKAEYRSGRLAATAFAADTPYTHRRDEIQGNGLSGPYGLSSRDVLINSEQVKIEVRDRLRSDRIVDQKQLIRNVDYDIDYRAGTIRFREPILSRTSNLDPQFIVVDFEIDGVAKRVLNAGGRGTWTSKDKKLVVGATAIRDEDESRKTMLGGADLRYRPSAEVEIRAEIAASDANGKAGAVTPAGTGDKLATAWLVQAEHHGAKYDLLAYAQEQQAGFGVGQQNAVESGTRKYGVDGRLRVTSRLSLSASGWREEQLTTDATREAGKLLAEYRGASMDLRAGISLAQDRLADGTTAASTIAQLGATRRLLNNKLELDAQSEFALGGQDGSVDFPARQRLSARYSISPDVQLVGAYEIAKSDAVDARTARIGFDLKPWAGARLTSSVNRQDIAEYGPRSFAAYGLSQSVQLGHGWSADATLDGNRTLGGIDPTKVLNPKQPVASGGFLGQDGTLTENFTAVTAGATYRGKLWSMTGRAEYRAGRSGDRYGFTAAALRQIGEGSALGGSLSWLKAGQDGGARTAATALAISWAHRPQASRLSWLERLDLRDDRVWGAVAGMAGPIGGAALTVSGDVRSRRIVNSLSVNLSPTMFVDGTHLDRSEISLFWGSRYVFDRYGGTDIKGWSNLLGADIRYDIGRKIDVGVSATLREGVGNRSRAYAIGPSVGLKPFDNGWLSVGWNVRGFADRDYRDARYTHSGPYVTMRFKFDETSFAGLGLRH